MKTLILNAASEGWIELVRLTDEQKQEMLRATPERMLELAKSTKQPASSEDAAKAQFAYDRHKVADADLISCDISFPTGAGIINCRVNGKHKQIRFDGERVIEPYVVGK
jgi:hypothetical protein